LNLSFQPALAETRALLKDFEQVSQDMAAPGADIDKLMNKMERLQTALDACNGWELERKLTRAMESLRCPPGNAKVDVLSGGERRRVALCRLLLEENDIL
jgi:sulfate-transporting ATPase